MAVRIVKDFWSNFRTYETILRRSFLHWHGRFPNPGGQDEAWNDLLVSLHALEVFGKWNRARLVFDKKKLNRLGKCKTKAEINKMADREIAKRKLHIDRKFEYFIFRWVQQVLSNSYQKRLLEKYRYVPWDKSETCNSDNYLKLMRNSGVTSWDEDEITGAKKLGSNSFRARRKTQERQRARQIRDAPTIDDISEYGCFESPHPLDDTIAEETRQRMRECLPSFIEKKIFDLKQQGYSGVDIAYLVPPERATTKRRDTKATRAQKARAKKKSDKDKAPITPSYVSLLSKRMQSRCACVASSN